MSTWWVTVRDSGAPWSSLVLHGAPWCLLYKIKYTCQMYVRISAGLPWTAALVIDNIRGHIEIPGPGPGSYQLNHSIIPQLRSWFSRMSASSSLAGNWFFISLFIISLSRLFHHRTADLLHSVPSARQSLENRLNYLNLSYSPPGPEEAHEIFPVEF